MNSGRVVIRNRYFQLLWSNESFFHSIAEKKVRKITKLQFSSAPKLWGQVKNDAMQIQIT